MCYQVREIRASGNKILVKGLNLRMAFLIKERLANKFENRMFSIFRSVKQ